MRYTTTLLLLLSGCSTPLIGHIPTTANYEAGLKKEVGKSSSELVEDRGIPSSTMRLSDGTYVYQYRHSSGASEDVTRAYSSINVDSTNFYCATTFFIKNDRVDHFRWEGNACRSN